ncbi:uncharacterized protein LOC111355606 [Spodoptera litura]|uniref:Uncharacterized protein LOC111355606 n=1 Tax=Spodoptera litura TaxID=69820 RepID=A0A9J7IRP8_SPOLT|nr:uncharacterized protein LOC111355606 [Spodoptera litura]
MSNPGTSPFSRSQLLRRSPPPTPTQESLPPEPKPNVSEEPILLRDMIPTEDILKWTRHMDSILAEVCTIVSDGKMNSEQKTKVQNLCRNALKGTSEMAVAYQALKQKALLAHSTIQNLREQQTLAQSLQQFQAKISSSFKANETSSYANVVKKGADNYVRPQNLSSVAIYPSDKTKTSDDTKSLVQKIISPEVMKLHVRSVRKIRDGGVIISTENKADIDKLKNAEKLVSSGLTVQEPAKRRPKIAVIGVPSALSEKEVLDCIYEQNLSDKMPNSPREPTLATIKLSHKSGKKNLSTCNYVLEVPPSIRKILLGQGRLFINWTSCAVRDYTIVTRCFNCQQFGHAAKYCRETSPTCHLCGDSGHSFKECSNKAAPPKCATCKRFKRKSDHSTGDMMLFLMAILFAFTEAGVIDKVVNCIVIGNVNYEREVLVTNVESPYQLVIDHDTNTLFFSYTARSDEVFKSAFINLKTNEFNVIPGIHGGFANAVNNQAHIVYLGGQDGVYQFDYKTKNATKLNITQDNIWQMFYKNGLYFTTYPEEKAYVYKGDKLEEVAEVKDHRVMVIGVNNDGNTVYTNSSGIFFYDKELKKSTLLSFHVANAITSDLVGNLYISTATGIYSVNGRSRSLKELVKIDNIYGVAMESNENIIYSSENSIIRLKPSNKVCIDETMFAKNVVELDS